MSVALSSPGLSDDQQQRLKTLCRQLVNQAAARTIVLPQAPEDGFWFGGGNLVQMSDGTLWLVGRYRNRGDSRTGLGQGTRGLELALLRSSDAGRSFQKVISFEKQDLNVGSHEVISIKGAALRVTEDGVELYVSTEKSGVGYPPPFEAYLKPGTGVWSIDRLRAQSVEGLQQATVESVLSSNDPRYMHVKDPFIYERQGEGILLFCSHPFSWTSSNTGYVSLGSDTDLPKPVFECFPRGVTWDVAMSRGTCVVDVPPVGAFENDRLSIMFYDGGECVRNLDEHASAVQRPRGYSCEELGGAAVCRHGDLTAWTRLSRFEPLFVSPYGTGCSRYVDVCITPEHWYVTWQQSQADRSQPLVMNVVSTEEVHRILGA